MSKSKVRSMQRGAQFRSTEPGIRMQDIYDRHPPQISSEDKPHLDFEKFGRLEQEKRVRQVITAAKKNGIGTASEISRLLNKLSIKTAAGENWTPRLAWFAAASLRGDRQRTGKSKARQPRADRSQDNSKFRDKINDAIKPRLREIRDEFESAKPTIGDTSPELSALKKRLETKS